MDKLNLTSPNPTPEQVQGTRPVIERLMPLGKGEIIGEWYWQVSSPCYQIVSEYTDRFRKRWQPGIDSPPPLWGKRKAKWSTSEGAEKNYDLPLYCRNTPAITWYAVGDKEVIAQLLQNCTHIGKKRSIGNGQVLRWKVEPIADDWHLWRNDAIAHGGNHARCSTWGDPKTALAPQDRVANLMRPMPYRLLYSDPRILMKRPVMMNWGWRPPAWLPSNKEVCVMPKENVVWMSKSD